MPIPAEEFLKQVRELDAEVFRLLARAQDLRRKVEEARERQDERRQAVSYPA